jgi:hypothetical protein
LNSVGNEHILTLKIADGAGGYEAGKLIKDTSFYISKKEWSGFDSRMTSLNFWNTSTTNNSEQGKDGSEWILEGKMAGKYHFVNRWTPNTSNDKAFRECCDYLIMLAGLTVPDKEMY